MLRSTLLQSTLIRFGLVGMLAASAASQDLYDETVLRTLELTFKQTNWQTQLTNNYVSKTYIKADLKVDGKTYKDVGVRYRGNSSYKAVRSIKKPFKIKFDAFGGTDDLYGYHTLNLNNGFRDPAFVREVLSYKMFRRMEPASRANWVKLIINGRSYGVYINVEQINKDMLKRWFDNVDGFRYRGERGAGGTGDDPAFRWLGTNPLTYRRGYELKSANTTGAWTNLVQTCNVLNNTPAAQMPTAVPKILDVDGSLRYLAGNNLLPAMDSYIGGTAHNFYIYEDPKHKRTALLPWDHNATYGGNAWLTVLQKQRLSPWYMSTTKPNRPLVSKVIVHPEWRARYIAHMRSMIDDFYNWKYAGPIITQYQKLIEAEVQKDPLKLYPFSQFKTSVTTDLQVYIGSRWQWIPGIKPMIEKRTQYLKSLGEFRAVPPTISQLTQTPLVPKDRDTVWVTARIGKPAGLAYARLYWRTIGAYTPAPMFDDGKHGDGAANDGVYGAGIPPHSLGHKIEYYVVAQSAHLQGGAAATQPTTAGFQPPSYVVRHASAVSPIRINEALADNETVIRDPAGDYDDWVELTNTSKTSIDISGYFLSDDVATPKMWTFPAGTTIAPGGFLLVWLDNEPAEGPYHATFKLNKDGESILLSDKTGKPIEMLHLAQQKADRSFGLLPDGNGGEYFLFNPTGSAPQLGGLTGRVMPFDIRRKGSPQGLLLTSASVPKVGNTLRLDLTKGPANNTVFLGIAVNRAQLAVPGLGPLLIDPTAMLTFGLRLDAQGATSLSSPLPASSLGFTVYMQAAATDLSNGLAVRITR